MAKLIDLTGQRFGRLTVVSRAENKGTAVMWFCKCDCGNFVIVGRKELRRGDTKSCGCFKKEVTGKLNLTHGESETRLYRIWAEIKARTLNENVKDFKYYGKRGLKLCDEWLNSYESFKQWALNNGYQDDLTIERINNDKGYCPDNCKWILNEEQSANRRSNHYATYGGQEKTLAEWAKNYNITRAALQARLKRGWSIEKALTTPTSKK